MHLDGIKAIPLSLWVAAAGLVILLAVLDGTMAGAMVRWLVGLKTFFLFFFLCQENDIYD